MFHICSFGLNLSSEPSIETLPEYNGLANGNILYNHINDETIANFCSDTSRELNNLTEELQCSDLDIRKQVTQRSNHLTDDSHNHAKAASSGHSDDVRCQTDSDASSDIVESSPFYTQAQRNGDRFAVDNTLFNLSLNDSDTSSMAFNREASPQVNQGDAVDGCYRGGSRDSLLTDCMLQSVDLAGKCVARSCQIVLFAK